MESVFFSSFMVAQLIGALAMAIGVSAWYLKETKKMAFCFACTDILWAIQYFLLGAPIGGLILLKCAVRNGFASYLKEENMKYVIFVFLFLVLIITCFNFKTIHDLLPFIGTVVFSLSLLKRDNRSIMARAGLFSNLCWTAYALFSFAIPAIIYGLIAGTIQIYSMIKYEQWQLGKCFKTFPPSFMRSLFVFPSLRTYP